MLGLLSVMCHPGSDVTGIVHIGRQNISVSIASSNRRSIILLGMNYIQFHTFLHVLTGSIKTKHQINTVRKISACTLYKES